MRENRNCYNDGSALPNEHHVLRLHKDLGVAAAAVLAEYRLGAAV